jgi:hypothetical protein
MANVVAVIGRYARHILGTDRRDGGPNRPRGVRDGHVQLLPIFSSSNMEMSLWSKTS